MSKEPHLPEKHHPKTYGLLERTDALVEEGNIGAAISRLVAIMKKTMKWQEVIIDHAKWMRGEQRIQKGVCTATHVDGIERGGGKSEKLKMPERLQEINGEWEPTQSQLMTLIGNNRRTINILIDYMECGMKIQQTVQEQILTPARKVAERMAGAEPKSREPELRVTKISHTGYFREKTKSDLRVASEYGNASMLTIETSMGELGKWLYVTGEREKTLEAELSAEGFELASSGDKVIPFRTTQSEPSRYCAICSNKECDYAGDERVTTACQWNPPGPKEPEKVYPFDCSNCGVTEQGACELSLSECSGENGFARWVRPHLRGDSETLTAAQQMYEGMKIIRQVLPTMEQAAEALTPKRDPE